MSMSNTSAGQKRKAQFASNTAASSSKKRQKFHDARAIPTQTADAALSKTGELNIASFIRAREFEINALDKSMKRARQGLMSRAFQQVPRHLRRRTASHNAQKIPKRLRRRAEREMRDDNTPKVTSKTRTPTSRLRLRMQTANSLRQLTQKRKTVRQKKREVRANAAETDPSKHVEISRAPVIKKNKLANPPLATSKFKKRQVSKTWLPTHLWHTKRAHMTPPTEPLWRMAIPLTPTEKSYRATHRAAGTRGCIAWDTSYMSTIGCLGTERALESLLRAFRFHGESWTGQRHKKWKHGSRFARGWISNHENKAAMAELDVLWCTSDKDSSIRDTQADMVDEDTELPDAPISPKKQKIKLDRRILIRVHPSAFHQFWTQLLKVAKMQRPQVLVEDLRFEIGSLEITGPGSSEALVSVLKTYESDSVIAKLWTSLSSVSDPALLPLNALIPLNVSDPRLCHPPKKLELLCDETSQATLHNLMVEWPIDTEIRPSSIFSHRARYLAMQLPTQKAIDRRRRNLAPGQSIPVTAKDPSIPVVLLAHRQGSPGLTQPGSWTLLAPWKCIDAVWRELMTYPLSAGNRPRFGGLRERQQIAFERREPWFPCDFPGTEAGKAWEGSQTEQRFDDWIRRPPSRRLAWQSLDLGMNRKGELGRGWACDWEYLFTGTVKAITPPLSRVDRRSGTIRPSMTENRLLLTQRQRKAAKAQAEAEETVRERNTSSPESEKEPAKHQSSEPLFIQAPPTTAMSFLQGTSAPEASSKPIIISVRITLLSKGTPKAAGRIYRLPARIGPSALDLNGTDQPRSESLHIAASAAMDLPATSPESPQSSQHANEALDLRTRWLSLDSQQSAGDLPRKFKKDKLNHRGLTRKHQHHGEESLRHINVLPKNAPAEIREQYGRKPLTESEEQEQMAAELAVKLEEAKVWDTHIPCPDADDLIGFVTSAGYNLAEGRGTAIGGLWLQRVLQGWAKEDGTHTHAAGKASKSKAERKSQTVLRERRLGQDDREKHLCIVRNAGESIGRLGIWELCG